MVKKRTLRLLLQERRVGFIENTVTPTKGHIFPAKTGNTRPSHGMCLHSEKPSSLCEYCQEVLQKLQILYDVTGFIQKAPFDSCRNHVTMWK